MKSKTRRKLSITLLIVAVSLIAYNAWDTSQPRSKGEVKTHFTEREVVTIPAVIEHSTPPGIDASSPSPATIVWAEGDTAKVTVEGVSEKFIIVSLGEDGTALLEGYMPAEGNKYDIQYPYDVPDLDTQTHEAGTWPKRSMVFEARNCDLSGPAKLQPQSAILVLKLFHKQLKTAKRIIVTLEDGKQYVLDCGNGVAMGNSASSASTFYMVVDPCEHTRFTVTARFTDGTSASASTRRINTFTIGQYLDMPAKELN